MSPADATMDHLARWTGLVFTRVGIHPRRHTTSVILPCTIDATASTKTKKAHGAAKIHVRSVDVIRKKGLVPEVHALMIAEGVLRRIAAASSRAATGGAPNATREAEVKRQVTGKHVPVKCTVFVDVLLSCLK